MEDMSKFAASGDEQKKEVSADSHGVAQGKEEKAQSSEQKTSAKPDLNAKDLASIIEKVKLDVTNEIINILSERFLGQSISALKSETIFEVAKLKHHDVSLTPKVSASKRISEIQSFALPAESSSGATYAVKLGSEKRGKTYTIGGANCMPFHFWEGKMPNKPLIAMEVFDSISEKYPEVLRNIYGDVLTKPADMAKLCVSKYGADLISVKLDGIHPERENRSAAQSVELVKSILAAVDVPLIISGINHYEKNNEVLKAIAQACEGENLLFNFVEQDNYRTIAGAALAYGHTLVAQAPIDVNISKQLNILLTNMGIAPDKIIIDPMTSTIGYGIEYTYSVMERIRLTGLGGDNMLLSPMIVSVGQECAKIKEFKASEAAFPDWGDLVKRAAYWEVSTATSLIYAGADILIMYTPEAVMAVKKTINDLMSGNAGEGR